MFATAASAMLSKLLVWGDIACECVCVSNGAFVHSEMARNERARERHRGIRCGRERR